MQNQKILSNSKLSRLNFRENLIHETEYFIQKSRNLRNSDRNPGTVEKRVSLRKTFVTFVHNKCCEAEILNDLQPAQSRDNLFIVDSFVTVVT